MTEVVDQGHIEKPAQQCNLWAGVSKLPQSAHVMSLLHRHNAQNKPPSLTCTCNIVCLGCHTGCCYSTGCCHSSSCGCRLSRCSDAARSCSEAACHSALPNSLCLARAQPCRLHALAARRLAGATGQHLTVSARTKGNLKSKKTSHNNINNNNNNMHTISKHPVHRPAASCPLSCNCMS